MDPVPVRALLNITFKNMKSLSCASAKSYMVEKKNKQVFLLDYPRDSLCQLLLCIVQLIRTNYVFKCVD